AAEAQPPADDDPSSRVKVHRVRYVQATRVAGERDRRVPLLVEAGIELSAGPEPGDAETLRLWARHVDPVMRVDRQGNRRLHAHVLVDPPAVPERAVEAAVRLEPGQGRVPAARARLEHHDAVPRVECHGTDVLELVPERKPAVVRFPLEEDDRRAVMSERSVEAPIRLQLRDPDVALPLKNPSVWAAAGLGDDSARAKPNGPHP